MKTHSYGFFLLALLMLLASCDLLGIGGDDGEEAPEPPQPQLVWQLNNAGGFESPPPVIEDSTVFFANTLFVGSATLQEGEVQWLTQFEDISPLIIGKILSDETALYMRFEQSVRAYNKSNGSELWRVTLDREIRRDSLAAATVLLSQSNTRLFVGTREGLQIFGKEQGTPGQTIIPEVFTGAASSQQINIPVVSQTDEQRVFLLSSFTEQNTADIRAQVAAYNVSDGSQVWEYDIPSALPRNIAGKTSVLRMIEAGSFVVILTGSTVYALDSQTGNLVWTHAFVEQRSDINLGQSLAHEGNSMYAGLGGGRVQKLNLANRNLQMEFSSSVPAVLLEEIVVSGGRLYFTSGFLPPITSITVVDVDTGEELYQISPPGGILSGFTPSLDVAGSYVINVGILNIYAYELP